MPCPCLITAEFMTRLGAVHAAQMHRDRDKDINEWKAADWRAHISEEDKLLRPYIAEHFPLILPLYDEDHRVFLDELTRSGKIMSLERMHSHAKLEDWMTLQLIAMGY